MAQVSIQHLETQLWGRVWRNFIFLLKSKTQEKEIEFLVQGLLTDTEKTMLAKRLMVNLLLLSEWPTRQICLTMKMSLSTIYKLQVLLDLHPEYKQLLQETFPQKIPFNKEKLEKSPHFLLQLLDNIFEGRQHRSRLIYGNSR